MLKILTVDNAIADKTIPRKNEAEISPLADRELQAQYRALNKYVDALKDKYHLANGGKTSITKDEMLRLKALTGVLPLPPDSVTPGGSAANTIKQLSTMMKGHVQSTMVTVLGDGEHDPMLRQSFKDGHTQLFEAPAKPGIAPESAVSFIFPEDNDRIAFTYRGTAKDLITPEVFSPALLKDKDVFFVPLSLLNRSPAVGQKLIHERWERDRELWVTLPTSPPNSEEVRQYNQEAVKKAEFVGSNETELMDFYRVSTLKEGLDKLREALEAHVELKSADNKTHFEVKRGNNRRPEFGPHKKKPFALITHGKEGAYIVVPGKAHKFIPTNKVEGKLHTIGAGDAAMAGALIGHILGMNPNACGRFAVDLATENIQYQGACLPDPQKAIEKHPPSHRARLLLSAARNNRLERHSDQPSFFL